MSVRGSAPCTATRRRAYWAAFRTLPLVGERTGRHVQGRVAVRLTLPLGGERTGQRALHCHSMSSVPYRHVRGRVAVRPLRPGASGSALYTATRCRAYRIGTFRAEWQCWPGRTPNPQPSCRLESGPTGQMRSGNRSPGRRGVAPEPAGLGLGPDRTERRSLGRGPC